MARPTPPHKKNLPFFLIRSLHFPFVLFLWDATSSLVFLDLVFSTCRSPSPEPIYSSDGKRLNTREYRKRKELEELRHHAITRLVELNTDYKPPSDYK